LIAELMRQITTGNWPLPRNRDGIERNPGVLLPERKGSL
jgi:hypothetical protein